MLVTNVNTEPNACLSALTYLFGQVIIHDECVSSVVSEEFTHGTAGVRSEVLQWRCIGRRRAHYDCILHRVGVRQPLHDLCDGRPLLTDGHVDAIQLGFLVLTLVEPLLINDRVDCYGRLAANAQSPSPI